MHKSKCSHCNTDFLSQAVITQQHNFCCIGCRSAYYLIHQLKLDKYYDYCKTIYDTHPVKIMEIENTLDYIEHISVDAKQNVNSVSLLVDGIRCGACVWLLENTLRKQEHVLEAQINLSSHKLSLKWSGAKENINAFIKSIENLGYKVTPFIAEAMLSQSLTKQRDLLKRLTVAGAVSAQVMMISFAIWSGNLNHTMGAYTRILLHLFIALVTIPAVLYSGAPFFKSAWNALRSNRSNMDVPISIGIIFTTFISVQETVLGNSHTYYDAAISLIFILLIGRYLDVKVLNKANAEAHELILSQPSSVTIIEDGKYKLISIRKAVADQIAFVAIGERIPIDGIVIEGMSEVDNSIITGETIPIIVQAGSTVFAGGINHSGSLKIKITRKAENSTLNEIIQLIDNAKQVKSRFINIADKVAAFYTPTVLSLALLTFTFWYALLFVSVNQALLHSVAVLVVTCPCALGLAVPIVQTIAASRLMKNGILMKSQNGLENLSRITDIIFDKTGTLTFGKPIWLNQDDFPSDLQHIIISMAKHSKHPLMRAITLQNPDKHSLNLNIHETHGMGIDAVHHNKIVKIGNRAWCNVSKEQIADLRYDDHLETWFEYEGTARRLIFRDQLRPEAYAVIQYLEKKNYVIHILSGDREEAVAAVAQQLNIKNYRALLTPQDKFDAIQEMQRYGKKVLMVGDGLNDSPALQIADCSLSPANALAISSNNADAVFQKDLYSVLICLDVARKYIRLIKENFALSLIYNVLTVPIAMVGLMTPLIAAIAMASSSLMVVINAMRLKYVPKHQYKYIIENETSKKTTSSNV